MALKNDESVRQKFIRYIKEHEDVYGGILTFSKVRADLSVRYPQYFVDEKTINRVRCIYSGAISHVRKEILEKNILIKTRRDITNPKIQKTIKEAMAETPDRFMSGGNGKTIVLKLQNNDKVFFKVSSEVRSNLMEFIKYWHLHAIGQQRKATATKAFFTAEMVEEYYRIFSETRDAKKSNAKKIKTYKDLEKGMM